MGANRPRSFLLPEEQKLPQGKCKQSRKGNEGRALRQEAERAPVIADTVLLAKQNREATTLNNQRYIRETGQEARIVAIIAPVAEEMGYDIVRAKILPDNGCTLQIMAEDQNGRFTITDCERLSREINPVLDAEEPIDRAYHLEVSSPGVDRPLVRARDFARYIGHEARIELSDMIDGRKRYRGEITASDETSVTIALPDAPMGADPNNTLAFADIAEAKLMMTDALLEAARLEQENDDSLNDPDLETVEEDNEEK